ncbi:hypothetical protein ACJX0J_037986, partial [Zea mays]
FVPLIEPKEFFTPMSSPSLLASSGPGSIMAKPDTQKSSYLKWVSKNSRPKAVNLSQVMDNAGPFLCIQYTLSIMGSVMDALVVVRMVSVELGCCTRWSVSIMCGFHPYDVHEGLTVEKSTVVVSVPVVVMVETAEIDYSSRFSAQMYSEAKLASVAAAVSRRVEKVERDYLSYDKPRTVLSGEACNDLDDDQARPTVYVMYICMSLVGLAAKDIDGSIPFFWGVDSENHLVFSDDAGILKAGRDN